MKKLVIGFENDLEGMSLRSSARVLVVKFYAVYKLLCILARNSL